MPDIALTLIPEPYGTVAVSWEMGSGLTLLGATAAAPIPPTISVSPAEYSDLTGKVFRVAVENPDGLGLVAVIVVFESLGVYEVAYFDGAIPDLYSATAKSETETGFILYVERRGGRWPSHPTFKVAALSSDGAIASE